MVPVPQIQEQIVDVGGQEQVMRMSRRLSRGGASVRFFWDLDGTQFLLCAGRGRRVLCQFTQCCLEDNIHRTS